LLVLSRRLFYLQLKQDFLDEKLLVPAARLPAVLALMAQIEYGDAPGGRSNSLATKEQYSSLCPNNDVASALCASDDFDKYVAISLTVSSVCHTLAQLQCKHWVPPS